MQVKIRKNIGLSLIVFAFFFLFEPSCGLIDPLPDVLGYIIICIALTNLSDINDKIASASRSFQKGILLNIFRIACYFLLNGIFSEEEKTVGLLLFVFIFAVFELIFIIPAYKNLFEGLVSLAMFEGGDAVYQKKQGNKKNTSEKTYIFTVFFLAYKNILWMLPELTTLETSSGYEFVNIMRVLSIIAVIPVSAAWLINMIFYFVRVRRDKLFIDALENKYIEKAEQSPDYFVYKSLNYGLSIFMISLILTFDFYSEGVNILPEMLFALVLIASAFLLRKYSKKWLLTSIFSSLVIPSSLAVIIAEKRFYEKFFLEAVRRDVEAYNNYNILIALYLIQSLLVIVSIVFAFGFLKDVYFGYCKRTENEHEKLKKESEKAYNIRLYLCVFLGVMSAIASVYHIVSLPRADWSWIYYYSGIISSVFSVAFAASAVALIGFMKNETKNNYKTSLL